MEQSLSNEIIPNWYVCVNCSEYLGKIKKMYCPDCGTVKQREDMRKENNKIREAAGLKAI